MWLLIGKKATSRHKAYGHMQRCTRAGARTPAVSRSTSNAASPAAPMAPLSDRVWSQS